MTRNHVLFAVALWGAGISTLGCAGASGSQGLSGLWRTRSAPRHPFRCPTWLQFYDDGTVETNLPRSRCYSASLLSYSVRAPHLEISRGRRQYRCRYSLRGDRLKLACGKRSVPPDFSRSLIFHRRPAVRRGGTFADLAGTWQMRFFRRLSVWTISKTGRIQVGAGRSSQITLVKGHTPHRMQVQLGRRGSDHCIYRVGSSHLTMCCTGHTARAGQYPRSFAKCRFPIVLLRK